MLDSATGLSSLVADLKLGHAVAADCENGIDHLSQQAVYRPSAEDKERSEQLDECIGLLAAIKSDPASNWLPGSIELRLFARDGNQSE
jgi:hypothetical protein